MSAMLRRMIPVMFVLAMFAPLARADGPFVKADDFDIKSILQPPPAIDSDQEKQEIEHLLKLQNARTPEDVTRCMSEVKMTPFIFSSVLGSRFNPDDLPVTAAFLKEVFKESNSVSEKAKLIFLRKRPFAVDPRIIPCVQKEKTDSYPSGHSTRSLVAALTLGEIFPDQRDGLIARAWMVGEDRQIAGQHFPSDVEAGRVLAKVIFAQMQKNPDFQAALEKAKEECLGHEKVK